MTPQERLKLFIETEDWNLLNPPLVIPKKPEQPDGFWLTYVCPTLCGTCCIPLLFGCCWRTTFSTPAVYQQLRSMEISQDKVWAEPFVMNEACCIVPANGQAIQLEDVHKVYIQQNFALPELVVESTEGTTTAKTNMTLHEGFFGNVNTTGTTTYNTEYFKLKIEYLEDPESAVRAIEIAKRLFFQHRNGMAPTINHRSAPSPPELAFKASSPKIEPPTTPLAPATPPMEMKRGSSMLDRMERIEILTDKGVLTQHELAVVKVALLGANPDPTRHLMDLLQLWERQMVNGDEYLSIKKKILKQACGIA